MRQKGITVLKFVIVLIASLLLTHTLSKLQTQMFLKQDTFERMIVNRMRKLEKSCTKILTPDYKVIQEATVTIHNFDKRVTGSGIGIMYKNEKYILSVLHLDETDNIYVKVQERGFVKLKLAISDKKSDLALFVPETELNSVAYVTFKDNITADVGTRIWVSGNPMNIEDAIISGIITKTRKRENEYLIDAPIWFGSSGGGVWNEKTELIGITTKLLSDVVVVGDNDAVELDRSYGIASNLIAITNLLELLQQQIINTKQ